MLLRRSLRLPVPLRLPNPLPRQPLRMHPLLPRQPRRLLLQHLPNLPLRQPLRRLLLQRLPLRL